MADEGGKPDIEKIRQLAALMERRGLSRLALTEAGVTVRLETGHHAATMVAPQVIAAMAAPVAPHLAAPEAAPEELVAAPQAEPEPLGVPLVSPTTGTFYRAPAPGEPPFVEVGDTVEAGQPVGIIMAMKVMSEIPAETAGEIVAIPAEDGQLVQTGATLIVIKPA